jgi:hypothetical protein
MPGGLKTLWRQVSGKLERSLSAELADGGEGRLAPAHASALDALLSRRGAAAAALRQLSAIPPASARRH